MTEILLEPINGSELSPGLKLSMLKEVLSVKQLKPFRRFTEESSG